MKYLGLLFLVLLVACPPSKKDEPNIITEEIQYSAGDTKLNGFLAYDANQEGKRPGSLVVHEWWGHNEYARERTKMLAELGYTAFALDMYGDGKTANHPKDAEKFMMEVINDMPSGVARFNAALDLLKSQATVDPEKIGAIGYCFGGAIVLHMAKIGTDLDGVVSFHGVLGSMHKPEAGSVKAEILVCHGADDPFTPQEQIDGFRKELDDANVSYKFIEYEGATHSFTSPRATKAGEEFNLPLKYNEAADKKSWRDMQDFFNNIFGE